MEGAAPAKALHMDQDKLEEYWEKWLLRLDSYRKMRESAKRHSDPSALMFEHRVFS